jgi:hypothetical protein
MKDRMPAIKSPVSGLLFFRDRFILSDLFIFRSIFCRIPFFGIFALQFRNGTKYTHIERDGIVLPFLFRIYDK